MDLRCLTTLKTILAEGSFQKAAQRLNCTQSTVTFQVRQLEHELSVQLFERIGRRMILTQPGADLLPYFDSVLRTVEEMKRHGERGNEPTGDLRVAVAESILSYRIQPVLKAFVKYAPKVRLTLCALNCHDIRDAIVEGTMDMGVYYDVGAHPDTLEVTRLRDFEGVLVASPSFPRRHRDFDTPGQAKDASFVINEPRSIFREIMERHLRSKNMMLRNTIELWSIESIKKSVISNLGFTYLPRFAVEKELKERSLERIPAKIADRTVTAICVHHRNKVPGRAMLLFKELLTTAREWK